jgi:hypothetical protein
VVANSGVFAGTAAAICAGPSPFTNFLAFSDWLYARAGRTYALSRASLREARYSYLTEALKRPAAEAAAMGERDALNAHFAAGGAKRQARRVNAAG